MEIVIVEDFQCGMRRCLVLKREMPRLGGREMAVYYNGYVELLPCDRCCDLNLESEEETFRGKLDSLNEEYVGFDTAHSWNFETPYTQRKAYSVEACKKIVDELNFKRLKR